MQKTDGALAQSRRGFHVELGAREKAVSIFYIYLCSVVGIGQIGLFRKEEMTHFEFCFGRILVCQIVIEGSVIVLKVSVCKPESKFARQRGI